MKIGLAAVTVNKQIRKKINQALDEGMIGGGRFIKEFEEKFAKYIGVKYAVFVANGTLADTLAVAAIKDGKRNEVIMPALTFVAQPNAVLHAGLKPVFVDVNQYGQIDPEEVKKKINRKTLAIFATHLLGRTADVERLSFIAREKKIHLLEDCCEALGAELYQEKVGSFGTVGTFSFYASHHISTGEGGMCTTNDPKVYKRLISLRNHGRRSDAIEDVFTFDEVGWNAKGTNLQAAIGSVMIDKLDKIVEKRRKNIEYLGGWWLEEQDGEHASPHCFPIFTQNRDEAIKSLFAQGIEARPLMASIPTQCPAYMGKKEKYPWADWLGAMGLFVPCHQNLSKAQLKYLREKIIGI